MKRMLAFFLAFLMLLMSVSCGTNKETTETQAQITEDGTYAPEETETDFFPNVERNDYKKEVFRMIGFDEPGLWYYADEYSNEQGSVHILNNTIYEMNTLIEDYLNIQIEYERIDHVSTGGEIFDTVQPTIMSGDDTYQLCILHPYYSYTNFITKNYALDFYDLPDLDIDQPYWNKDVMEQLSINDHAYIGLGDICKYTIGILYCNKDMLKDVDIAVPYDMVRNGNWTLDEFFSMTSGLYADNGDGKRNNSDTYGFASLWDANASSFMQASGIYIATRNEEGVFELSLYGDRLVDMYDKLYNWSKNESTYLWNFANKYNESVNIDFLNSQAYFTHADLGTQYLEANFGVGMLPMPKYDAEQSNYAHVNWGNNIVIPTTVQDKAMVGQVLELMGYYSKTMVQQKYYDEVLQLRVSDAPDDREMVELIYNTIVYDPGIAFCDGNTQLWNLVYLPCFAIQNNATNISSYYKGNSRSAERWLANLFKER